MEGKKKCRQGNMRGYEDFQERERRLSRKWKMKYFPSCQYNNSQHGPIHRCLNPQIRVMDKTELSTKLRKDPGLQKK